jgi:L-amino acid N-acyltransferase YncA
MTEGHTYPLRAPVGGEELTLRMLGPEDTAAVVAFARRLPEHDLLFLARDITQPDMVEDWMADENITTIGAFRAESLMGYAAIHRNERRWSAHVAELRVMVDLELRGKGLGRVLTQEAFAFCLAAGVEKMTAQMTLDQKGAIAVFESLGFRPEALLRDHVKDREGKKHDLLVLSHEVARFAAQRAAYGVSEAFGQP